MIEFHLSVDALGKTRFAYSPLGEVASSLRLLGEGRHAYVMMPWLRDVRGPPAETRLRPASGPGAAGAVGARVPVRLVVQPGDHHRAAARRDVPVAGWTDP